MAPHTPTPYRYSTSQVSRTLVHPALPQSEHERPLAPSHMFVVTADTQIGMTSENREWETELAYSRVAIAAINKLEPRPLFVCVCGDLVDMTAEIFATEDGGPSREECNRIQDAQNADWKRTWDAVDESIALVCVCGNHDVGNRPSQASIHRFVSAFGDDYLSFWANGSFCIVLNSNLFADPRNARDLYDEQLRWLKERLEYANEKNAQTIFVFGHHPWFLYSEEDDPSKLHGKSPKPDAWGGGDTFPDGYFVIPPTQRKQALDLFRQYNVTAAFSGHFHQNMISRTSFGMPMIVTAPLSIVFRSSGVPAEFDEPKGKQGMRIVTVFAGENGSKGSFEHKFVGL